MRKDACADNPFEFIRLESNEENASVDFKLKVGPATCAGAVAMVAPPETLRAYKKLLYT
jgi:hypothetical protein